MLACAVKHNDLVSGFELTVYAYQFFLTARVPRMRDVSLRWGLDYSIAGCQQLFDLEGHSHSLGMVELDSRRRGHVSHVICASSFCLVLSIIFTGVEEGERGW